MKFEYKTRGTCSSKIFFDVEDGCIHNLQFIGGCNGNLQGISRLVEGMKLDDVVSRVKGVHCGMKQTSCPDQLALAILAAKEQMASNADA